MNTPKPSWKPNIFWLVIGLPLASIIAGVGLVVIATRSGGTDVVRDEVRRVSQIQTTNLGPDAEATRLGLSAVLRVEDGRLELIPASGEFDRKRPLLLVLQHPSRGQDDLEVELAPSAAGWQAKQAIDEDHDWIIRVAPLDDAWRLHARLPRQQHATRLAPSLER